MKSGANTACLVKQDALFWTLTAHCFYGCGHIEKGITTTGSLDAMERHYWDKHYASSAREQVLAARQPLGRIGSEA